MAHPGDYKVVQEFAPQYIMDHIMGRNDRPIVRAAWKLPNGAMLPMTFLCDTMAPAHVYLSQRAMKVLRAEGVLESDDLGPYVHIHQDSKKTFRA